MTLVDHAIKLVEEAERAGEVRQGQARADQFDGVSEVLEGASAELERMARILSAMSAEGCKPSPTVAERARDGRGEVAKACGQFEADRSWLVEDRNGQKLGFLLKGYQALVETELDSLWNAYREALPPGERQLVAPLLRQQQPAQVIADAKTYLENETFIERILSGGRPDESMWKTLQCLLKKRSELRANLPVQTDPEIAQFVNDCQSGGARLDQLSDKVIQWLKDTGQTDDYRIFSRSQ